MSIPSGYTLVHRPSEFTDLCGPFYEKQENGVRTELALRIQDKHRNLRGISHGGLLVTLADSALGDAIIECYDEPVGLVTVTLSTDFLKPARIGDWARAIVNVQRAGKRMAFAECSVYVEEDKVLRASGVFAVMDPAGRR
jgi:uncharacterized protein (TIGR00369 family)